MSCNLTPQMEEQREVGVQSDCNSIDATEGRQTETGWLLGQGIGLFLKASQPLLALLQLGSLCLEEFKVLQRGTCAQALGIPSRYTRSVVLSQSVCHDPHRAHIADILCISYLQYDL